MKKHIKEVLLILLILSIGILGLLIALSQTKNNHDSANTSAIENIAASNNEVSVSTSENDANNPLGDEITYTLSNGNELILYSCDADTSFDENKDTIILLSDNQVKISGDGVSISDNSIIITDKGTYIIEGTSSNAQIVVDASKNDYVHIVLNNAGITCTNKAPIKINKCLRTVITLAENSINSITDSGIFENGAKACINSKCDLVINGTGSLNINAGCNNGISCKSSLIIIDGNICVNAANNGLRSETLICILGGNTSITCKNDGIKASDDEDLNGVVYIVNGEVNITADDDCIVADNTVLIEGGNVYARCYDKTINCDGYVKGRGIVNEWM